MWRCRLEHGWCRLEYGVEEQGSMVLYAGAWRCRLECGRRLGQYRW